MPDFSRTDVPQVHHARRRAIARAHPEVRALSGPHPSTPAAIVLVVAVQLLIAWSVRDLGVGWVLLLAYGVGAVFSHALYTLIHECTHNLAARGSTANKVLGIVCDLALALPSAIVFRTYHLVHHRHMGEEVMDPDIASAREARLVGNAAWRKALWMALFSVSQALRPLKTGGVPVPRRWVVANAVAVVAVDALVLVFAGPAALLFLLASTVFALGLHPLGGRWIQEHYVTRPGQETYSYYGLGNLIAFNVGYHNEHHDFMTVPWVHLPKLRRIAPEYYEPLASYRSWTAVLLRFVFDPAMSPFSRIVHPDTRRGSEDQTPAIRTAASDASGATTTSTA